MKKNSKVRFGIGCSLVGVIVSGLFFSFLVMPAGAMSSDYKENRALWDQIIKNNAGDSLLLPQPPYITDNPTNRGTYTGPCPIGTGGAPQLNDTGLSTGALCRGACGMDCPADRCKSLEDWTLTVDGGTCTYKHIISCLSHKGCRDHDACYDYCSEKAGDSSVIFGHCHGLCNQRCYDEYGISTCFKWAGFPSTLLLDKTLLFSDEPVFTPDQATATQKTACDSINPYDCWTMDNDRIAGLHSE